MELRQELIKFIEHEINNSASQLIIAFYNQNLAGAALIFYHSICSIRKLPIAEVTIDFNLSDRTVIPNPKLVEG